MRAPLETTGSLSCAAVSDRRSPASPTSMGRSGISSSACTSCASPSQRTCAAAALAGGLQRPGVAEFLAAQSWLKPLAAPCAIEPYLLNTLSRCETSVIQTTLDLHIPLVATADSIARLRAHGIWLGAQVQTGVKLE